MNHQDHVHLLRKGVTPTSGQTNGVWADLGAGTGAFTLALADLLGPTAHIYAVDKDRSALQQLEQTMRARFPSPQVKYLHADFTHALDLPELTGVVMANSLHFVRKKDAVLQQVRRYLQPGGRLVLVEYNVDRGNPWVPYPFSYESWQHLARQNGFTDVQLLEKVPSRFLQEIYSASSVSSIAPASGGPS
jgi:ubiquinone/menaquinone biosynthesis C-methylase UbiE